MASPRLGTSSGPRFALFGPRSRILAALLLLTASAAADPIIGDAAPAIGNQKLDGIVVVDFFATRCGPCIDAVAALDEIVRRRGVRLIVVDVGEPPSRAQAFFAARPLPPGAQLVFDERGELARSWGQHRFPTTFVVAASIIRHINRGFGPGYAARLDRWIATLQP